MTFTNITVNFNNESFTKGDENCDFFDDSLPVKITKIVLFSIILLSSLVGNSLIVIIVYKREDLRKTTNYFIVNMAVSDIIYPLQAIPFHLVQVVSGTSQWPIGGTAGLILCKLGTYLRRVSATVSVESLVWIAVDRFIAVVLPMKAHLMSSRFRAFAIGSTWIVAMVINCSDLYAYELKKKNDDLVCEASYDPSSTFITYAEKVRPTLIHIAPLPIMTILYCVIVKTLRRQDKALNCDLTKNQMAQRKQRAIKMSVCIMIAFYICVLPMLLLQLTLFSEHEKEMSCPFFKGLAIAAYLMFYLSSTTNPIICMAFVQRYRHGMTDICQAFWHKCVPAGNVEPCQHEEIIFREIDARPTPLENP